MTLYQARPYAGDDDYERLRRLLVETYALSGPPVYCTLGDLDWWRAGDDDPRAIERVWLWEDAGGKLVGFVWPNKAQVDVIVHPHHQPAVDAMVVWAEAAYREAAARDSERAFTVWADDGDRPRIALLERLGYERTAENLRCNVRSLSDVPAPRPLPPGYRLSDMAHETDLEQRVAVHRDAFAPSRMTVEKQRRVMASPSYRPDLDLVVVAPVGSFASYCIVWLDAENGLGLFEPVGCHAAHRRQGLTSVVLAEGMRRLVELGATTAYVNSHGDDVASNRLYESSGFAPIERIRAWRKVL